VHRPAAAALRSGAGVGVGRHGSSPAAAVAGQLPRARGWGDAPGFLARLRGRLGIQGWIWRACLSPFWSVAAWPYFA